MQGISTRKVAAVTEQLRCPEITSGQVSRAAVLDGELEKWRSRPPGETPYLTLDARYEHLIENAMTFVPRPGMRKAVVASIRAIFDAPDRPEAERQLVIAVRKYRASAPKLAEWPEANIPEGLAVFALPPAHRRRLRTITMLERLNEERKRRTRVATLFPNEASALRLAGAVAMEISDEWEAK